MRSSLVVRASDCQCTSCNSPGFDPSIRWHSGIWGAADEAVLNIVWRKKNPQKIFRESFPDGSLKNELSKQYGATTYALDIFVCRPCLIRQYFVILYFSNISMFVTLMPKNFFLLERKGSGGENCVGLFCSEYSKVWPVSDATEGNHTLQMKDRWESNINVLYGISISKKHCYT